MTPPFAYDMCAQDERLWVRTLAESRGLFSCVARFDRVRIRRGSTALSRTFLRFFFQLCDLTFLAVLRFIFCVTLCLQTDSARKAKAGARALRGWMLGLLTMYFMRIGVFVEECSR